jgi:hypothetical protein
MNVSSISRSSREMLRVIRIMGATLAEDVRGVSADLVNAGGRAGRARP